MPRFLLGWLLSLASAAIGLFVATLLFGSNFDLSLPLGFIWAVVLYAVLSAIVNWAVLRLFSEKATAALPLTGLVSTFLALLLTTLISNALTIKGIGTWLGATVVVWVLSILVWLVPGPWRNARKAAAGEQSA